MVINVATAPVIVPTFPGTSKEKEKYKRGYFSNESTFKNKTKQKIYQNLHPVIAASILPPTSHTGTQQGRLEKCPG